MEVGDDVPNVVNISEKLPTQNVDINLPLTSKNSKTFTDEAAFDSLFDGDYDSDGDAFSELDKKLSSSQQQPQNNKKRKEKPIDLSQAIMNDMNDDYDEEDEDDDFIEKKLKKRTSDDDDELNSFSEERESLGLVDFDDVRQSRGRRAKSQPTVVQTDDRVIQEFIEKMEKAYREDKEANRNKQPALSKLKFLPEVLSLFQKQSIRDSYFEGGFLKQCKNWLTPLPDGTLPNMKNQRGNPQESRKVGIIRRSTQGKWYRPGSDDIIET